MITEAVYSKFTRGLETYHRNTGKRHPLQPDVVSADAKRDFGEQPITTMLWHHWMGMYVILRDRLCLRIGFDSCNHGGDTPGECVSEPATMF
jgi:hypothetical protein